MPRKGGQVVITISPEPVGSSPGIRATYTINALHPYVFKTPTGPDPKVFVGPVEHLKTARDIPQTLDIVQAAQSPQVHMVLIHISVIEVGPGADPMPVNLTAGVTIANPGGQ